MRLSRQFLLVYSLLLANIAFANNNSIEFFASNNTQILNLETAYVRLIGKEQHHLQKKIIQLLQKNHIEQGKFTDVLGLYHSSQMVTADNSEIFHTSPDQHLFTADAFALAKKIAVALKQESVAVFIPGSTTIGDITVSFNSHQPNIKELLDVVAKHLPPLYSAAFSLKLSNRCNTFYAAKVSSIKWLGSKTNLHEVKKVFPLANIHTEKGKAYLVYQNGQIEAL